MTRIPQLGGVENLGSIQRVWSAMEELLEGCTDLCFVAVDGCTVDVGVVVFFEGKMNGIFDLAGWGLAFFSS
jgi:hypothetical protein